MAGDGFLSPRNPNEFGGVNGAQQPWAQTVPGREYGQYGGPMGPGTQVLVVDDMGADEKVMHILRYSSTVKCISIFDSALCLMMALLASIWFAVIAPFALFGYWGAKQLKPVWLSMYMLFLVAKMMLRIVGGIFTNRLWAFVIIAIDVYILYIVHRLRMAILSASPQMLEDLKTLREFKGFAWV